MELPTSFPFSKLTLPANETVVRHFSNPTFHRDWDYGIVITGSALYLFWPYWLSLRRWRRYALSDIECASFTDSRWHPKLIVKLRDRLVKFLTPFDDYADEMDFDRKALMAAAETLRSLGIVSENPAGPQVHSISVKSTKDKIGNVL